MEIIKKTDVMETTKLVQSGITPYIIFPLLEKVDFIRHGFSTRLGGVSRGVYASMNLSYTRGDHRKAVDENYERMASVFGVHTDDFVCSHQTHTTNIRVVSAQDRGKGVTKERDYEDIDGLITNVPGIMLVTYFADCVPIYLVDNKMKAIGLVHAGWRGTVGKISVKALQLMQRYYGTNPADVTAAIGPSICKSCYEVSEDVADAFREVFGIQDIDEVLTPKLHKKYWLDLWRANQLLLQQAGIKKEQIAVTDLCTCCNPALLFSHRVTGENRGNLAAFLGIF